MIKILLRTKFSKLKPVRYISHLELMDTIRFGCRRAGLPVAFSGGYNPRIKLSMCQPLSVGMTGFGEYFDLELTEPIVITQYINSLNNSLPPGIRILKAIEIPASSKSLQAIINTAIYRIDMNFSDSIDQEKIITDFINRDKIEVTRKRRNKKDRIVNLEPMLYNIDIYSPYKWDFTVSTGSSGNVRPSEIIRALVERYENIKQVPPINIERRGMFVRRENRLFQPFSNKIIGR